MNTKTLLLTIGNTLLFVFACTLVGTGLMLKFRFEESGVRFWGMGLGKWGDIHFTIAVMVSVLAVIHVILNWAWIQMFLRKSKLTLLVLLGGLSITTLLLFWPADKPATTDPQATPQTENK